MDEIDWIQNCHHTLYAYECNYVLKRCSVLLARIEMSCSEAFKIIYEHSFL